MQHPPLQARKPKIFRIFLFLSFLTLLVFAIGNTPTVSAQLTQFQNIQVNTSTPQLYAIYEISFDLSTTYSTEGRFDPNTVDVQAIFNGPGGVQESMPGFFKQESSPNWAVRYAPRVPGSYNVTLQVTDANGTNTVNNALSFTTSAPLNSGFIELDPANPARLMTSNGDQYTMVGINTAWEDDLPGGGWDLGMVQIFDKMNDYNINTGRVMEAYWSAYYIEAYGEQYERGQTLTYEGLGKYHLTAAANLDTIFQNAQARDIRVIYSMLEHLGFTDYAQWGRNAYNSANGGPCAVASGCYLSNATAREYTKRFLRYHFARWGSYTSFGVMELWNEVDNGAHNVWTDATQADVWSWHQEMDSYWKSFDFYDHPTTTSLAWRDHEWPEDFNQSQHTWPVMSYFDITNQHRYPGSHGTVDEETWIDQIKWLQTTSGSVRPAFIEEYGWIGESATGMDPHGYYFHDGAWTPVFFAEAAGTNFIWRVDYLFQPTSPTFDGYKGLGAFILPEAPYMRSMSFIPEESLANNVGVGAYKNANRALLYFRDWDADATVNNGPNQPTENIGNYTLTGMNDGSYTVEFWDTMTGNILSTTSASSSGGSMTFAVPSFQRGIAAKVYNGAPVPTPTPGPTSTPAPPTNTPPPGPTNTPTNTAVPPTATNTAVPGSCSGLTQLSGLTAASTIGEGGSLTEHTPVGNVTNEQASSSPTSYYKPGWNTSPSNPTTVYVDLGSVHCVKEIRVFDDQDGEGSKVMTLFTGSPGNWTQVATITLDQYQAWRTIDIPDTNTRYVRFHWVDSSAIGEATFYVGSGGGGPTNTPVPPTNTPIPPTNTPVPPTPTNTPVPPTPTNTPIPGGCNGLTQLSGLTAASTIGESGSLTEHTPVGNMTNEQSSSSPTSWYKAGWYTTSSNPTTLYVDLGSSQCLKEVRFYDDQGSGTLTVFTGSPGNWTQVATTDTDLYQVWRTLDITDTQTRYVRFHFVDQTAIGEATFYVGN